MLVAAAWVWLVGIYGAVLIAGCFLVATLSPYTLPPTLPAGPTLIYAADGSLLARLDAPLRLPITLGDVPPPTVRAILAAEDIRFFHHHGLDWRGLLRAGWAGVRAGAPVQGGSTITQQLVRFQLLDDRQPLRRKVHEMVLAIRVERAHTKREILERYLNTVYFGDGACGIGAAAERYFGKPVGMLTLAESALLAGCIRAPSEGDPRRHLVEARGRQRATLTAMRGEDWITEEEYIAALRAPLLFAPHPAPVWCCPYAVEAVRRALLTTYGRQLVYQGGLSVYTTIQPRVQAAAEATVVDAVRTG